MKNQCSALHDLVRIKVRLGFPFDPGSIPANGIYLLFEKGEKGHGGDRIVRVGTHRGDENLFSRLREHFLVENKDRSIFRKNIGRALLAKDDDPFLLQWEYDLTSRKGKSANAGKVNPRKKDATEQRVTRYIQDRFSFVIIPVGPGTKARLAFEERLISTISLCEECKASKGWLGHYSPVDRIRKSGMWNYQGLWKAPISPADLSRVFSDKLTLSMPVAGR